MKKILLPSILGALCLFYVACSSENDQVITDKNAISTENAITNASTARLVNADLSTAVTLYRNMMSTTAYINFTNSKNAFTDKLLLNRVNFATRSQWVSWITANRASTSFTSIAQFESMYDDAVNKLNTLMTANTVLFSYMSNADIDQLNLIIDPEFDGLPEINYPNVAPASCLENCINAHSAAYDAAYEQLQFNLNSGEIMGGLNGHFFNYIATNNFNKTVLALAQEYTACAGGCGE